MADTKITGLTALTTADTGDLLVIVDISDTSMAASGTDKKITAGELLVSGLPGDFNTLTVTGVSTLGATDTTDLTASGTLDVTGVTTLGTVNATDLDVSNDYKVAGTQILTAQQGAIADATGGVVDDAEARAAINSLLAACRTHGIIAT